MPKLPKPANPALLAVIVEGFFSRFAFGLIAFALPLYARSLGMGLAEIGVLVSINLAVATVIKLYGGSIADRLGYKRGALASIVGRSAVALLLAVAGTAGQLYALQVARGLAKSLRDPSVKALIAEHGRRRSLGAAFAWYQTAKSAAGALGKAVAGVMLTLTAANYSMVFVAAFVFSLFPFVVLARFVPKCSPGKSPSPVPLDASPEAPPAEDRARSLWPLMGFGVLASTTAQTLRGLFPVLAVEYGGLNEAETGLLYLLATAVVLLSGPFFGWLSDNVSRKLVLSVRGVANVVSSTVYLAFPSFPGFAVAKAVDETGKAAFRPAWGVLMAQASEDDRSRRGRIMGQLSAAEDAGSVAGPILAGVLWSSFGVVALLGARIALAILTELYALALFRGPRRGPRPSGRPGARRRLEPGRPSLPAID